MTIEQQIIEATRQTLKALRAVREARNASQLQHGGANFSRTTDKLNQVADKMAELHMTLTLDIATINREEVAAAESSRKAQVFFPESAR